MKPPWEVFPDMPFGSLGWRMGDGEGYLDDFLQWMYEQPEQELKQYFLINVPPAEWLSMLQYHKKKMKTGKLPWEYCEEIDNKFS